MRRRCPHHSPRLIDDAARAGLRLRGEPLPRLRELQEALHSPRIRRAQLHTRDRCAQGRWGRQGRDRRGDSRGGGDRSGSVPDRHGDSTHTDSYDDTSTYGFLIDDHSSSWSAHSSENGHHDACGTAKLAASADLARSEVDGFGVVGTGLDAVVFSQGKLPHNIGVSGIVRNEVSGEILAAVAKWLAAANPKP